MQDQHDAGKLESWGRLYVTRRCCGAATCRNYAPELLGEVPPLQERLPAGATSSDSAVLPGSYEVGAFTGVLRPLASQEDLRAARTAVAGCPFGALRLEPASRERARDLGSPWHGWPRKLEDNVWALGHPSVKNFGASAYFIERQGGGVLVDPPKPREELFRWLAEHGGVRWLFMTHRDHTHHHGEFASRFPGCQRILGAADVNLRRTKHHLATGDVEIKIGGGPEPLSLEGMRLPEDAIQSSEFAVLPQPGHTPGSLCLLYRGRFLFTGDHLSYSRRLDRIVAFRLQCWQDWERQIRSVRQLLALAESGHLTFAWILPGHGEWHRLPGDPSATATTAALRRGLEWMECQSPGHTPFFRYIPFVRSRLRPNSALAQAVRFIGGGGAGSEAWLLPRSARTTLPDYDPDKIDAALRSAYLLSTAALAATFGIVWLASHAAARFLRPSKAASRDGA